MEYALNEQDRARLYFLQEQIKDRVLGENCSEELRLVTGTVMEICRILSGLEKYQ
ncbi:MAG: hypothetical protein ABR985_18565 [Methanotrichaceae archaeon]|jgi:hypothetical protein